MEHNSVMTLTLLITSFLCVATQLLPRTVIPVSRYRENKLLDQFLSRFLLRSKIFNTSYFHMLNDNTSINILPRKTNALP